MDRYSDLRAQAAAFVSAHAPVLIVAPTRMAAEEATREACGAALLGVRTAAFRDLVLEMAMPEMLREQLVPVGRFVREALAARVTAEALERNELQYLAPAARFPGFARALTGTFEE